jgi:AraC-like DNA-binding protein
MTSVRPARLLLRAKDLIDARYFEPLDVPRLACAAHLSPAHFSREFRRTFRETPLWRRQPASGRLAWPRAVRRPAEDGDEELKSRGVELTEAPAKRPYGIDAAFRDPSGNQIRVVQTT